MQDFSQPLRSIRPGDGMGVIEAARQRSYTRIVRHAMGCRYGCIVEEVVRGIAACNVGHALYQQAIVDDAVVRLR